MATCHRTCVGRVVYDRPTHFFHAGDAARIISTLSFREETVERRRRLLLQMVFAIAEILSVEGFSQYEQRLGFNYWVSLVGWFLSKILEGIRALGDDALQAFKAELDKVYRSLP